MKKYHSEPFVYEEGFQIAWLGHNQFLKYDLGRNDRNCKDFQHSQEKTICNIRNCYRMLSTFESAAKKLEFVGSGCDFSF